MQRNQSSEIRADLTRRFETCRFRGCILILLRNIRGLGVVLKISEAANRKQIPSCSLVAHKNKILRLLERSRVQVLLVPFPVQLRLYCRAGIETSPRERSLPHQTLFAVPAGAVHKRKHLPARRHPASAFVPAPRAAHSCPVFLPSPARSNHHSYPWETVAKDPSDLPDCDASREELEFRLASFHY